MRRLTPLLAFAFAACADAAVAPRRTPDLARIHEAEGSHGGTPFSAVLVPGTEVPNPPGGDPNPSAGGFAVVTLNSGQEEVCFEVTFSGLSANVSDAHIHEGPAGVRGPVVVPFAAPVAPLFPAVTAGSVARCVPADRELIKRIRKDPENFYVNIHTRSSPANPATDRPGGAIRGPLTKTKGSEVNQF
jgi:hypothetical protein